MRYLVYHVSANIFIECLAKVWFVGLLCVPDTIVPWIIQIVSSFTLTAWENDRHPTRSSVLAMIAQWHFGHGSNYLWQPFLVGFWLVPRNDNYSPPESQLSHLQHYFGITTNHFHCQYRKILTAQDTNPTYDFIQFIDAAEYSPLHYFCSFSLCIYYCCFTSRPKCVINR